LSSSALDIFFIVLGCYFVIRGCMRGFVGEILTFAGFILGGYLSFRLSGPLGNTLAHSINTNKYAAQLLAIVIVWLGFSLLVAVLRRAMRGILRAVHLGGVDRVLGIFTGLLKTAIVIYVFLIGGLLLAPVKNPSWMTSSDTLRFAGRQWPAVRQVLVDFKLLSNASELPDGTLEQILRPYRTGDKGPNGYEPGKDRT